MQFVIRVFRFHVLQVEEASKQGLLIYLREEEETLRIGRTLRRRRRVAGGANSPRTEASTVGAQCSPRNETAEMAIRRMPRHWLAHCSLT